MERGEWDNDADYPRAPLPQHERTWRHPSELGAEQWVQSEPPLAVGRGLSVATGAVGTVLALSLLWLMIPHGGQGPSIATQSSSASSRSLVPPTSPPSPETVPQPAQTAQTSAGVGGVLATTTTISSGAGSELPTSSQVVSAGPVPTMVLDPDRAPATPPIAVAFGTGHFVVTTASAVRGREQISVKLPSGVTVLGAVVAVDVVAGTAVLSVSSPIETTPIETTPIEFSSSMLADGGFTLMMPEAITARLWRDGKDTMVSYDGPDGPTREGSIVLDSRGRLMGMCTAAGDGLRLVAVGELQKALISASGTTLPPWIGIEVELDVNGLVVVIGVTDGSPADDAGFKPGDVILGIDGAPIGGLESVRSIVSAHTAGDVVSFTMQQGTQRSSNADGSTGTASPRPTSAMSTIVTTTTTTNTSIAAAADTDTSGYTATTVTLVASASGPTGEAATTTTTASATPSTAGVSTATPTTSATSTPSTTELPRTQASTGTSTGVGSSADAPQAPVEVLITLGQNPGWG